MTTYSIKAPNGKTYIIEGPPGASDADVRAEVMRQDPSAGTKVVRRPFRAGLEGAKSGLTSGLPYALDRRFGTVTPEEEAKYRAGMRASAARQEELLPGGPASFESMTGIADFPRVFGETLAYGAPQIGATILGGMAGGAAGTAVAGPGPGTLAGAVLGGTAVGAPFFAGSNVGRATEGGERELDRDAAGRALIAAPGQAALDSVGNVVLPGIGRLLGRPAAALAGKGVSGLLSRTAKGALVGAGEGAVTEVGQQVGERYAAGLPLGGSEAQREYLNAAATAAIVGGPIGGVGAQFEGRRAEETPPGTPDPADPSAPGVPSAIDDLFTPYTPRDRGPVRSITGDADVDAVLTSYGFNPENIAGVAPQQEEVTLPEGVAPVTKRGRKAAPLKAEAAPVEETAPLETEATPVEETVTVAPTTKRGRKAAPVKETAPGEEALSAERFDVAAVDAARALGLDYTGEKLFTTAALMHRLEPDKLADIYAAAENEPLSRKTIEDAMRFVEAIDAPTKAAPQVDMPAASKFSIVEGVDVVGGKQIPHYKAQVDGKTVSILSSPEEAQAKLVSLGAPPSAAPQAAPAPLTPKAYVTSAVEQAKALAPTSLDDPLQMKAFVAGATAAATGKKVNPTSRKADQRDSYAAGAGTVALLREAPQTPPAADLTPAPQAPPAADLTPAPQAAPVEAEAPIVTPTPKAKKAKPVFTPDEVAQAAVEVINTGATEAGVSSPLLDKNQMLAFVAGAKAAAAGKKVNPASRAADQRDAYTSGAQTAKRFLDDWATKRASLTEGVPVQQIPEKVKGIAAGRAAPDSGPRDFSKVNRQNQPEFFGDLDQAQEDIKQAITTAQNARKAGRIDNAGLTAVMAYGRPETEVRPDGTEKIIRNPSARLMLQELEKQTARGTPEGISAEPSDFRTGREALYSDQPAEEGPPLSTEDVRAIVKGASRGWTNPPLINIAQSFTDLPAWMQKDASANTKSILGATVKQGREVYIIADRHSSREGVVATLFHEALGHSGLAKVFKARLRAVMSAIYNSNQNARKAADEWLAARPKFREDLPQPARLSYAVEEVLALSAQEGASKLSWYRGAMATVRNFIRSIGERAGLHLKYSDKDILAILAAARKEVETGVATRKPYNPDLPDEAMYASKGKGKTAPPAAPAPAYPVDSALDKRLAKTKVALNDAFADGARHDAKLAKALGRPLEAHETLDEPLRMVRSMSAGIKQTVLHEFIQPLEEMMRKLGVDYNEFGLFLWARSAPDRNKMVADRSKDVPPPNNGSGLTNAEAAGHLQKFYAEGKLAKMQQLAKIHDALVDYLLAERVKAGLLSQEEAKNLRDEQPFYAALKGRAKDGDMLASEDEDPHAEFNTPSQGMGGSEFIRARGRESVPLHPLVNLHSDSSGVANSITKNAVLRRAVEQIDAFPTMERDVATYYTNSKPKIINGNKQNMISYARNNNEIYTAKVDGEPVYIEFRDTEGGAALRRAFENMKVKPLEGFMGGYAKVASVLRQALTTKNIAYLLGPAFMRDVFDSVTSAYAAETSAGSPALGKKLGNRVVKRMFTPAVMGAVRRYVRNERGTTQAQQAMDRLMVQMIRDGGSVSQSLLSGAENIAKDVAKRAKRYESMSKGDPLALAKQGFHVVNGALDGIAHFNDLYGRFATYASALELGIGRKGAAALALNSSLDLTRRGTAAPVLDNLFFFFSPTVEGGRKFLNMAFTSKNGMKFMGGMFMLGALSTLWNYSMAGGDDDEDGRSNFRDVSKVTRQTRTVLFYGDGADDYVAIPLGFMGALPQYIGSKAMEAIIGETSPEEAGATITGSIADMLSATFAALSPIRPTGGDVQEGAASIVPSAIKPLTDTMINRNFFGSPIHNQKYNDQESDASSGRETTGAVWKWLAQTVNDMSGGAGTVPGKADFYPESYRYIFESLVGGSYKFVKDTVKFVGGTSEDEGIAAVPLLRGFVGKGSEYRPTSNFYENTTQMQAIDYAYRHDTDEEVAAMQERYPVKADPRVAEAYHYAVLDLKAISKDRNEALKLYPDDPAERKRIIEAARADSSEVYKSFNRLYNQVRKEKGV